MYNIFNQSILIVQKNLILKSLMDKCRLYYQKKNPN